MQAPSPIEGHMLLHEFACTLPVQSKARQQQRQHQQHDSINSSTKGCILHAVRPPKSPYGTVVPLTQVGGLRRHCWLRALAARLLSLPG